LLIWSSIVCVYIYILMHSYSGLFRNVEKVNSNFHSTVKVSILLYELLIVIHLKGLRRPKEIRMTDTRIIKRGQCVHITVLLTDRNVSNRPILFYPADGKDPFISENIILAGHILG
jgi:hypothetical protein